MTKENWDIVIDPSSSSSKIQKIKQAWKYRDLLFLFVKRDIVAFYKQTILGPIWFFIQPIFTTAVFTLIGMIAALETDGVPPAVFYLSGIVLWNYFSEVLKQTAETFIQNRSIFSKVYFPRLIIPLSLVASHLVKFFIQCLLILAFYLFFFFRDGGFAPNVYLLLFPVLVLLIAMLGMGLGLIVSAMTTKYRDLKFLINFSIDLLRYVSPIIFPFSIAGKYEPLIAANPMSSIIEVFRIGLFDTAPTPNLWWYFLYTCIFAVVMLWGGFSIFSRVEKKFIDTV